VRALVTGAAGFVGRRLVPRLEREGWAVTAHDRELDVADETAVEDVVRRVAPGLIVHLAAVTSVPESQQEPGRTFAVNYLGTHSVLEAARQAAPEARVLLIGSSVVYGSAPPGSPAFTEASPLVPGSPYASTKAAADLLGAAYQARGLDVVRTRSFNHSGPGQSDVFALPSFARQAAEIAAGVREPVLQVGNLDSLRDFLDVDDVIEAYLALTERSVPAAAYNVASGQGRRMGDALQAILDLAGVEAEIRVDTERLRPSDLAVGDASRLHEATGWTPRVGFEAMLARIVDDWRERVSAG
jgi:GDP-4-dehydro-6-deoxy-D-mannose reductase